LEECIERIPCDDIEVKKESNWNKAYAELDQVLRHSTEDVIKAIPKSLFDFLQNNMDKTWRCKLDFSKELKDMDLLRETLALLALVYRDFICSEEEREKIVEKNRLSLGNPEAIYEDVSLRKLFKF